jgi:predicted AAA+ superfamily ATPase
MIKRSLERVIRYYSKEYPILSIVGPRQSGKTTLAKYLFTENTQRKIQEGFLMIFRHQ